MGHEQHWPDSAAKLRLASAFLSLWIALSFSFFLPLAYYTRHPVYFPTAACDDPGAEPPSLVISAGVPLSPGDDYSCALWDAAAKSGNILLREQAAPGDHYSSLSFTFSYTIPGGSKFKLLVFTNRAPPISFSLRIPFTES
jgi:hypothetical protein